jgi:hypothetical protein
VFRETTWHPRPLIVTIADGGGCLADLNVLREQPELFAEVASSPTAWRVIDAITPERLDILRRARRQARERAWAKGAAPERITLDCDATLVTAHSEKVGAAGNFKGGFGFHPMVCYLDESGEALAGILGACSRAAVTRRTSKISSVKPVSAPSARAISLTGMLMLMMETAAWIASSTIRRFLLDVLALADPVHHGIRPRARAARPGRPTAPALPSDALPDVPDDARAGPDLRAAPPRRSRRDHRRSTPGQGDRDGSPSHRGGPGPARHYRPGLAPPLQLASG